MSGMRQRRWARIDAYASLLLMSCTGTMDGSTAWHAGLAFSRELHEAAALGTHMPRFQG
jgi:hypothetical protein|tara:strand:- start:268 stop:444 length:177 start_codon:yes stop_codon:yes gene_type:complete